MMDQLPFLAILAMASYNRGYGHGLVGLPHLGAVENATILDIPMSAAKR